MKGMLVKDWRIFIQKKSFFILLILCVVALSFTDYESSFIISYFTIIMSIFTTSTVSYDEADNCYPFLFSLPVTRKEYVQGKYLFGIIIGMAADIISTLIAVIVTAARGQAVNAELFMISLWIIPVFLFMNSVTLPFNLKFGVEKGRIGVVVFGAAIFSAGFLMTKSGIIPAESVSEIDKLSVTEMFVTGLALTACAAVITFISYVISRKLLENKEL